MPPDYDYTKQFLTSGKSWSMPSPSHDAAFQDTTDFPNWLQPSGAGPLNQFQSKIPSFFDARKLKQTANRSMDSNFDQQRAVAAAAATAAQRRAGQGGGAVGASFAAAGAMTPLYAQRNDMNAKIAQIIAAMRGQQASLTGGIASQRTNAFQNHQGQLSNWAENSQRMNAALFAAANQRGGYGQGQGGQGNGGAAITPFSGQQTTSGDLGSGMHTTPAYQEWRQMAGLGPVSDGQGGFGGFGPGVSGARFSFGGGGGGGDGASHQAAQYQPQSQLSASQYNSQQQGQQGFYNTYGRFPDAKNSNDRNWLSQY